MTLIRNMTTSKHKTAKLTGGRGTSLHLIGSVNMRYISLACLTLQTTSIIITYSYSRKIPVGSTKYLSSTVVVIAEILKLLFCAAVIFRDSSEYHFELNLIEQNLKGELLTNISHNHNFNQNATLTSFLGHSTGKYFTT